METFSHEVFDFVLDVQSPQLIPYLGPFFVCTGVCLRSIHLIHLLDSVFGPCIPGFSGIGPICGVSPLVSVFF